MNNTNFESYLSEGCGRCERFRTSSCKVHSWTSVLSALRRLLLKSELSEKMKWGSPCYTLDGKNVVSLGVLNNFCALGFFKGAGLNDSQGLLEKPGPNSRYARNLVFRSIDEVNEKLEVTAKLIDEAIAFERSGRKIEPDDETVMPSELLEMLNEEPGVARAFNALTPGRRRSHMLHVGNAKKSETRARRAKACASKILAGKGYNER